MSCRKMLAIIRNWIVTLYIPSEHPSSVGIQVHSFMDRSRPNFEDWKVHAEVLRWGYVLSRIFHTSESTVRLWEFIWDRGASSTRLARWGECGSCWTASCREALKPQVDWVTELSITWRSLMTSNLARLQQSDRLGQLNEMCRHSWGGGLETMTEYRE